MLIKTRNEAHQDAVARIQKAIDAGYYLEAITLEECMISNCAYNYLAAQNEKLNQPTFRELLELITKRLKQLKSTEDKLFIEINSWRRKRNTAIHGFIKTKTDNLSQSKVGFDEASEVTARRGIEYWY